VPPQSRKKGGFGLANSQGRATSGLALEPIQQFLLYDAVDRSPALVFVADDELQYLAVNSTACRVLGFARDELLGMRVSDVVVTTDTPTFLDGLINEHTQRGDAELRAKDGTLLPYVYETSEVQTATGRSWVSVGFVGPRLFEKVDRLESTLLARVAIEQAKGILAGRHSVDVSVAFEAIRSAARAHGVQVNDLCRRVVAEHDTPAEIVSRLPRAARTRR
jgi:PAS domain S-box-containing protein